MSAFGFILTFVLGGSIGFLIASILASKVNDVQTEKYNALQIEIDCLLAENRRLRAKNDSFISAAERAKVHVQKVA